MEDRLVDSLVRKAHEQYDAQNAVSEARDSLSANIWRNPRPLEAMVEQEHSRWAKLAQGVRRPRFIMGRIASAVVRKVGFSSKGIGHKTKEYYERNRRLDRLERKHKSKARLIAAMFGGASVIIHTDAHHGHPSFPTQDPGHCECGRGFVFPYRGLEVFSEDGDVACDYGGVCGGLGGVCGH